LTFTVHHLNLKPGSVLSSTRPDDKIFVEFEFPYLDPEELQTPEAQIISYSSPITFNFSKTILITDQQKDVLKAGLQAHKALVRFTVVLEPSNEELECEDVGVALADLGRALRNEDDLRKEMVSVVSADNPAESIGTLTLSIVGHESLKMIAES
jgi:protein fantom